MIAAARSLLGRDLSLPLAVVALLIYLAGLLAFPPYGGLLIVIGPIALWLLFYLLIRQTGVFIALFLLYAVLAPLGARLTNLPLGWFKGAVFFAIVPIWLLSRVASKRDRNWWQASRIPLIVFSLAWVVFGLLAILSVAQGVSPVRVINSVKGHLLYVPLMFMAIEAAGDPRQRRCFLWWVVFLSWIVTVGAVIQSAVGLTTVLTSGLSVETGAVAFSAIDPISGMRYQRVFSTLDDQIAVASFSFLSMALCIYLLATVRTRWPRFLLFLTLALNAHALILTFNMTLLIGTLLFFVLLILRYRNPRMLLGFIIVLLIIGGIAWIQLGELWSNRLVSSFSLEKGLATSLLARVESNTSAIGLLKFNPFIGSGLGSTTGTALLGKLGLVGRHGFISTDNAYMNIALESGFVGLIVVLLLYLLPFWPLQKLVCSPDKAAKSMGLIFGTAVFVLLLMNCSNGPMRTNPANLLYWLLAGWAWRVAWDNSRAQPDTAIHGGPEPCRAGSLK